MKRERIWLGFVLVLMGMGWGLTMPLTKIAVSTGYRQFGLIFWDLVIGVAVLTVVNRLRGKSLPWRRETLAVFAFVALAGTVLPGWASYRAAVHLPAGIMSVLLSMVPMLAFPVALALRLERFRVARMAGLMLGLSGVLLLVLPEASLPERAMVAWIPIALIAPLCYAFEGNGIARWGTAGLDPIQMLQGAMIVGLVMIVPLMGMTGQWIDPRLPWGAPQVAIVVSGLAHVVVYTAYFWMVGRAGSVFAAQVSYFVTGFGMIWAMILLGETYSPYIWAALGLIFAGMFLVQPRPKAALAPADGIGETGR